MVRLYSFSPWEKARMRGFETACYPSPQPSPWGRGSLSKCRSGQIDHAQINAWKGSQKKHQLKSIKKPPILFGGFFMLNQTLHVNYKLKRKLKNRAPKGYQFVNGLVFNE